MERVRKDEETAEEANKAEQEARARHERAARFEELRRRVGVKKQHDETLYVDSGAQSVSPRHVNPRAEGCVPKRKSSLPQEQVEGTCSKERQRPWYESGSSIQYKSQDESLAREDPLNRFKKKASRPSSSSYLAVQKAKAQRSRKSHPA